MLIGELYAAEAINPLRNPAVSTRCKALLREREKKILVKQRLQGLLQQNQLLQKKLDRRKEILQKKLTASEFKIETSLKHSKKRIQQMEEKIVRSGCPGIPL